MTRRCGDCAECCRVLGVKEIEKPNYQDCSHMRQGNRRCSIYAERPQSCRSFECGWIRGLGVNNDRPDRSGFILSAEDTSLGPTLIIYEAQQGAANRSRAREIVEAFRSNERAIIIASEGLRHIVHLPPGKLALVAGSLAAGRDAEGRTLTMDLRSARSPFEEKIG